MISVVDNPLHVEVALGEIVMVMQRDAVSLTPEAAEETARRLIDAAKQMKGG